MKQDRDRAPQPPAIAAFVALGCTIGALYLPLLW